jgi:nicotinamide mononucleotide (NMN) deamidase PncC
MQGGPCDCGHWFAVPFIVRAVSITSSPLAELRARGVQLVMVTTGGGSEIIPWLLTEPGASAVVLEAVVPYARPAIDRLLGGPQEAYCSERAARRLAVVAWQRALESAADLERAVGLAITASLRSTFPKRGDHRIHIAVQSLDHTVTVTLVLEKLARTRVEEEQLTAMLALAELLRASAQGYDDPTAALGDESLLRPGEHVERAAETPPLLWRDLLAGRSRVVSADGQSKPAGRLLFPGSFDPLHEGHLAMARLAEEIAERPCEFELSIANVDKPLLDYVEMRTRVAQFEGRPLWLTRAPTFLEKIELFPDTTFVMGADTFSRLADPRYYGGSAESACRAVEQIAKRTRGLIVFGRMHDGAFQSPAQLDVPQPLKDVAYFVSEREFRMDVSSTQLRRAAVSGGVD